MTIGIVVGNPKPRSRTLAVAIAVASAVAGALELDDEHVVVDLADLGSQLFDWSSVEVREAVDAVASSRLVVVASPTYKATYTGLLKSFLDWYPTTGLAGVVAIPVMVGAGAAHSLAVEVHLRPVLVEIGATVPTRGLYVLEEQLDRLDEVVDTWLTVAQPALSASLLE